MIFGFKLYDEVEHGVGHETEGGDGGEGGERSERSEKEEQYIYSGTSINIHVQ